MGLVTEKLPYGSLPARDRSHSAKKPLAGLFVF